MPAGAMAASGSEDALEGIASPVKGSEKDPESDDESSMGEQVCIGCDISSRDPCPIAVRKNKKEKGRALGKVPRVAWGKTTSKKFRSSRSSGVEFTNRVA